MLSDLSLKPVYDSSECDLIKDLFIPLLNNSKKYYRGVGYFTSGWLRMASKGLINIIQQDGKIILITSPHIEEKDWEYIIKGIRAQNDNFLFKILKKNIDNLEQKLSEDTLNSLAWLIADNFLEIKFAIPRNNQGDFHDKFAIFQDEFNNKVVIHGSYNDSIKGTLNGESFSVFKSWREGHKDFVDYHIKRFKKMNNEENDFFHIYSMPDAAKKEIVELRKPRNRPYKFPKKRVNKRGYSIPENIELYDFQRSAINNWFSSDCKGIFKMATGTGKTITSLASAVQLTNKLDDLITIVSVPFVHLIDQWKNDVIDFGFNPILCRGGYKKWYYKLKSKIDDFKNGYRNNLFIIVTHKTSASKRFIRLFDNIKKDILIIGDEVHYLGSRYLSESLHQNFNYKIGLSATPDRWFDEEGTDILYDYFGKTVFEYSLEEAINNNFLTSYLFNPIKVQLNDDEIEEYIDLSKQISKIYNIDSDSDKLNYLRIKRADILNKTNNKILKLQTLLKKKIKKDGLESINHTIVYCGKGKHKGVLKMLSNLGVKAHEFVYTVSTKKRQEVLKDFNNKNIQVLVAMKCLDEGVDIPSTKTAYFLASTTNPREFIQRRGRILRTYPGKKFSNIYDFYIMPEISEFDNLPSEYHDAYKSIIKKEMSRFAEFSLASENVYEARKHIFDILSKYNLLSRFYKKPWEIYKDNNSIEGGGH